MKEKVVELWPELEFIKDADLKQKVLDTWAYALEISELDPDDLNEIPFTLLAKGCTVTFMQHKRAVVHISLESARIMKKFFADQIEIDMDKLVAGAILIDVGKLLEYVKKDGKATTGKTGKLLRHPFTGVALAHRFGIPDDICHMIATHSKEGDLGARTVESIIVHHADFLSFEPFKDPLKV